MITIVDYIYDKEALYFFAKDKEEAFTAQVILELAKRGEINLSPDEVFNIINLVL